MPEPPDDPLLAPKEIGARYGVSGRTVRRWYDHGLMPRPSFETGSTLRWRLSVIEAWERLGGAAGCRVILERMGQNAPPSPPAVTKSTPGKPFRPKADTGADAP